jgi:hypothetical protein
MCLFEIDQRLNPDIGFDRASIETGRYRTRPSSEILRQ